MLGICSLIFRYGVVIGVANSDPCRDLRGALVHHQKGQFAALTKPKEVGVFMLATDDYKDSGVVRAALAFSALTFCRPGEIRHAEWEKVDSEKLEWTIPAAKMKVRASTGCRCLVKQSKSSRDYSRARYMDEHRQLMQAWADYLDELRASAL